MLFVICTVFGVMLLVCQTMLSVLGIGETPDLWDEATDSKSELNSEANRDRDCVPMSLDVGQLPIDGQSAKPVMVSVRALGTAITFFGLTGSAAEASQFSRLPTFSIAFVVALITFTGVSVLFRLAAFQPYRTETKNRSDNSQEHDFNQINDEISNEEPRD